MGILAKLGVARQHPPRLSDTELKAQLMTASGVNLGIARARCYMVGGGEANSAIRHAGGYQISLQFNSYVSGSVEVKGGRAPDALVFLYEMSTDPNGKTQERITWGDMAWAAENYEAIIGAIYDAVKDI